MKRTTEHLLEDLLADDVSPDFRAALLEKTLRSARQRKHVRRFNTAFSVIALAGLFVFMIQETRTPKIAPNQIRQPITSIAGVPSLNPFRVVSTKSAAFNNVTVADSSDSTLSVIETTVADRPREIDDKELLALAGDKPVALIHRRHNQAQLIFLNADAEAKIPLQ